MTSAIIPVLRYRDAPAAIAWLERAFGFARHLVVPGPDGSIVHTQLRFGQGFVMLGSAGGEHDFGMALPGPGGQATSAIYIRISEVDAHCARAKAAGATIIHGPEDTEHGSRDYGARDPEGYIWFFGTYAPDPVP